MLCRFEEDGLVEKSPLLQFVEYRDGEVRPAEFGKHPDAQVGSHAHAIGAATVRQTRRSKDGPVETARANELFLDSPVGKHLAETVRQRSREQPKRRRPVGGILAKVQPPLAIVGAATEGPVAVRDQAVRMSVEVVPGVAFAGRGQPLYGAGRTSADFPAALPTLSCWKRNSRRFCGSSLPGLMSSPGICATTPTPVSRHRS